MAGASANNEFARPDFNGFINLRRPRGVAFDFEGFRCEVLGGAKCRGKRDIRTPVGEFEIHLDDERIALARDRVRLFTNRLLEFVEAEFSLLYNGGVLLGRLWRTRSSWNRLRH